MSLTLTIRNSEAAPEGVKPSFTLEEESAVIGRSPRCDWNLPDPSNIISSRHAELRRDGDGYVLKDISTNGTFLNDATERMSGEHRIVEGDVVRIGKYELVASITATLPAPPPPVPEPAREPVGERTVIRPAPTPPAPQPTPAPVVAEPTPVAAAASAPAPAPAPAEAAVEESSDRPPEHVTVMWDSLADVNKVDWSRGGIGVEGQAAAPAGAGATDDPVASLYASTGLTEQEVARSPELVGKAGALLKRLVAGLTVLVEARARAKAQMGAEMTGLQLEGNNPIKFARSPEQAMARLLSPPEPGFMDSEKAVEDAFLDIQAHQMATLRAMPGALRATLDRFSPGAVRRRSSGPGLLGKIFPAFRDAALWRSYESEYVKVKNESDEAFMDVFARGFRKAYEKQLREGFDESKPEGL